MANCASYDAVMLADRPPTVAHEQSASLFRVRGGTSQDSYSEQISSEASEDVDNFFEEFLRLVRNVQPFCYIKDLLSSHIQQLNQTYICDGIEYTPLHYAAAANEEEITQYLVDHMSIEPDIRTRNAALTPLQYAAFEGNVAVAEYLLNAGASVNARDAQSFTALHYAVFGGSLRTVELLIVLGADPSARTAKGCNILHISIIHNTIDNVHRLLDLLETHRIAIASMVTQIADLGVRKTPTGLADAIYGKQSSLLLRLTNRP